MAKIYKCTVCGEVLEGGGLDGEPCKNCNEGVRILVVGKTLNQCKNKCVDCGEFTTRGVKGDRRGCLNCGGELEKVEKEDVIADKEPRVDECTTCERINIKCNECAHKRFETAPDEEKEPNIEKLKCCGNCDEFIKIGSYQGCEHYDYCRKSPHFVGVLSPTGLHLPVGDYWKDKKEMKYQCNCCECETPTIDHLNGNGCPHCPFGELRKIGNSSEVEASCGQLKESPNTSHDAHYKRKHEPIEVMDELFELRAHMPNRFRSNLDRATKYILRCGLKGDEVKWQEDIDKAINYLQRAKTGKWSWGDEDA